ncbi:MAG: aminotransferase class I/II-fold pyridoxal phosphate-dependent enzyme, partial [Psychroflexus sp.]|nr:aminotransferase class I/II-fold pyridoxal phosphate-dependent enzyme [Psychroflexus sp.]
ALADVLSKYPDVLVISDEIYEHINFGEGHVSMASIPGMKDRTITVNGVSKAFAMTGWRIGYMAAPPSIAKACTKLQGQVTSGANCIAQRAVITALTESPDKIQPMIDIFEKRRKLILDLLSDMPGFETNIPQGAFYVFPNVSAFFGQSIRGRTIKNATDFSFLLLEEAHVATVTGEAFGNPDCIRISYAASDKDIKNAIQRIQDVVAGIL